MAKQPVLVNIAGQQLKIRSDAEPAYLRELAEYVDRQIEATRDRSGMVGTQKLALMAALHIADELFEERRKRGETKRQLKDRTRTLLDFSNPCEEGPR